MGVQTYGDEIDRVPSRYLISEVYGKSPMTIGVESVVHASTKTETGKDGPNIHDGRRLEGK